MENLTILLLEPYSAEELEVDSDVDLWSVHLSIENPNCEEGMQAAAEQLGTHADSIELVDYEVGHFALYRHLYRNERDHEEGCINEAAEREMEEYGRMYGHVAGTYPHLCGLFLLLKRAN